ncbi:ArsR/SmtB family transcription factor [Fibrobacterota bacterium]
MTKYMDDFIAITRALSDPKRVRVLSALKNRELCLCQITELLNLAPSTVSKHLSILRQAGLVVSRKEERWMYYRLPPKPDAQAKNALDWAMRSVTNTQSIKRDREKLRRILKVKKEALCKNLKT